MGTPLLNSALLVWLSPIATFQEFVGFIHALNYTVIQQMVSKGDPLLNRVLSEWLIPNAKFQIQPVWGQQMHGSKEF